MATRVEVDVAVPIGTGPDGHIALNIVITDVHSLQPADARLIFALIDKLAAWMPLDELATDAAQLPAVLRSVGGERA